MSGNSAERTRGGKVLSFGIIVNIANMNKADFKELTGEDPEDMFGGDWMNEVDKLCDQSKELTKKYAQPKSTN